MGGGSGLIFKGSGFYLTDYKGEAKKSPAPSGTKEEKKTDAPPPSPSTESKPSTPPPSSSDPKKD
jgi:hypothetical protein